MTLADLQAQCWAALPPIRKRLVGRDTVNDLVQLSVANWSGDYLAACQDNQQRDVYVHALLTHVKREHQAMSGQEPREYGFIWAFLLQAVAVAAVGVTVAVAATAAVAADAAVAAVVVTAEDAAIATAAADCRQQRRQHLQPDKP
jgi:hypothetical protein